MLKPVADRRLPVSAPASGESDRLRHLQSGELRHADDAGDARRFVGHELEGKASITRRSGIGKQVVGARSASVKSRRIACRHIKERTIDRQIAFDSAHAHPSHPFHKLTELFRNDRRVSAAPEPNAADTPPGIGTTLSVEPRRPPPVRTEKFESGERRHKLCRRSGRNQAVRVDGQKRPNDRHFSAFGHPKPIKRNDRNGHRPRIDAALRGSLFECRRQPRRSGTGHARSAPQARRQHPCNRTGGRRTPC